MNFGRFSMKFSPIFVHFGRFSLHFGPLEKPSNATALCAVKPEERYTFVDTMPQRSPGGWYLMNDFYVKPSSVRELLDFSFKVRLFWTN